MTAVLEGIRVLDWTVWQQGPMASVMLGDLGAEVIKIEDRVSGDPSRGFMRQMGAGMGIGGRNFYFEVMNRNKKSVTLDLNKKRGKEILYQLVEKSDVFLQNFRQGVAARLGMDYATLSRYNPRLIYASASGWGPQGPIRQKPAFDFTGQARSGMMTIAGELGSPPTSLQGAIGDQIGAIMTAYGVVAALLARERLGIGQEIDSSLLGSLLFLMGLNVSFKLGFGIEMPNHNRAGAYNPLWNYYKCSDNKWIALAELQADRAWPIVCRALGMQALEKDPRFDSLETRAKNAAELISIMDKVFATKTRDDWLKTLEQAGDLIFEPVNTISDAVEDPQVLANDYITDFNHPVWGKVKALGIPVKFSKTPGRITREAPEFGQHTEEVLTEVLGHTWDDIAKLKEEEVI
jgi:crotonobetainyl-CoA:carnitine CoA-transferase CaiB-like acyl-CoA transferase